MHGLRAALLSTILLASAGLVPAAEPPAKAPAAPGPLIPDWNNFTDRLRDLAPKALAPRFSPLAA